MKCLFYLHFAFDTLRKNKRIYIPFILSNAGILGMLYIVASLAMNETLAQTLYGQYVMAFLDMGRDLTLFFALIFIFYTNSFVIRRRRSELGLYNILGMGKSHIIRVVFWENMICFLISMIAGLAFGFVFERISFMVLLRILAVEARFGAVFSSGAFGYTVAMFAVLYDLLFAYDILAIGKNRPLDLLNEKNAGEKEPRAKWLIAFLGVVSLGSGYYLAIRVSNASEAILYFFLAVFLVVVGTYLLFTAGSITVFKLLKSNKRYYKINHFITVSNLMYRMKKNAVGLASICILSTMILVMAASTTSLWFSLNSTIDRLYPTDYAYTSFEADDDIDNEFVVRLEAAGIEIKESYRIRNLEFAAGVDNYGFTTNTNDHSLDPLMITLVDLDDYNRLYHTDFKLDDNEVMIYMSGIELEDQLIIDGTVFFIEEVISERIDKIPNSVNMTSRYLQVLANDTAFDAIYNLQMTGYGHNASRIEYYHGYTLDDEDAGAIFNDTVIEMAAEYPDYAFSPMIKSQAYNELVGLYSGFLFLGSFLGIVFMIAIVSIIYYKQISEGYEDQNRFVIMHKVGLSDLEIHKTINSQILLVFFAPLIISIIHVLFAYHMIEMIIVVLSSTAGSGMLLYTFTISTAVFAVIYISVFFITSKTYYRIVTERRL